MRHIAIKDVNIVQYDVRYISQTSSKWAGLPRKHHKAQFPEETVTHLRDDTTALPPHCTQVRMSADVPHVTSSVSHGKLVTETVTHPLGTC